MIFNQKDIILSRNYSNEFKDLIHKYLPHTRKYYVTLYIQDIPTQFNNNNDRPYMDTRLTSIQSILQGIDQGATYNVYKQEQTGIKYIKIENFPIWFMDQSSANTQLTINDIYAGYIQEFNIVVYKFPISNCFKGIDSFVKSVIEFDYSGRYFTILSENKYSALGTVFNTLYQCNAHILKQEFNPEISKTLKYSDKTHTLLSNQLFQLYETLINKLNNQYLKNHSHKKDYLVRNLLNHYYILDLIFLYDFLLYEQSQFSFEFPKQVKSLFRFFKDNNLTYNLPNQLIQYISTIKNKFLTCNVDITDLLNNITLQFYIYQDTNNNFYYSLNNNLTNFLNILNPNSPISVTFNLYDNYDIRNNSLQYWFQFFILMYLLDI